ncbi:hypothetical protein DUNSADRAFT_2774 [Dunaliella salina]|uniref:Encoded protein n=1 Tax=Dunaliella salina TaxID=3046 RepID=A0ABQ7GVA3_DUNSA|nr:hypothetical protein DUNSADRAFT_2774 [Dunaliella salina]|eukprot:KAF5838504.1 hypothetical protein DUNSADRAFT_2774 [Dunaliella salina]
MHFIDSGCLGVTAAFSSYKHAGEMLHDPGTLTACACSFLMPLMLCTFMHCVERVVHHVVFITPSRCAPSRIVHSFRLVYEKLCRGGTDYESTCYEVLLMRWPQACWLCTHLSCSSETQADQGFHMPQV